MSNLWIILIPIVFVVGLWSLFFSIMPKHGVIVYDCSIAEISPDYPIEVKKKCREARSGRI
jgi:hypothetical protein